MQRIFICDCLVKAGSAILRQAERDALTYTRIRFPNEGKRQDPRLNGRIGVEILRPAKAQKACTRQGRGIGDQSD